MIKDKRISLIIPCKNEEKGIATTISHVPDYVDEIIVVDNGSSDNTAEVAKNAGAKVVTENRKLNGIGYGYAHITGFANATGDYIFAMDGDDTYPAYQIKDMFEYMLNNDFDFVVGHRLPLKTPEAIKPVRRLGIYILNIEILFLYGRYIKDSLSGMWGVKKEAVPLLNLKMGDWNLSPEIKIAAMVNKNVKFGQFPIDHAVRDKEPSKQQIWKTGTSHFLYILKRRFTDDCKILNFLRGEVSKPNQSSLRKPQHAVQGGK
ncbi:MAG: glycosyltransferase family 2 protein [Patescibacteria group bacterium]